MVEVVVMVVHDNQLMDPIVRIIFTIKVIINIINVSIDQNLKLGNCRLIADSVMACFISFIVCKTMTTMIIQVENHHHRKRGNEFGSVLLLSVGILISEQD